MQENKLSMEYWLNSNGKILTVDDLFANEFVMSLDSDIKDPKLKFEVEETLRFDLRSANDKSLASYIVFNLKTITEKDPQDIYRFIVRFVDGYEPDIYLGFLYDSNAVLNRHDILSGDQPQWSWLFEEEKEKESYAQVFVIPDVDNAQFSSEQVFYQNSIGEIHANGMRYISKSTMEQATITFVEYLYSNTQVVSGLPPIDWQDEPPANDRFFVIEFGSDVENAGLIEFMQVRKIEGLHNVWLDNF